MASSAVLAIRIVASTRDAQKAVQGLQKDMGRLQSSLKQTAKAFAAASLGKALAASLGAVAGAAASGGAALGAFGIAAAGQIKNVTDASAAYKKYTDAQADAAAKKATADKLSASGSSLAEKAQKQYQSALLKVATTQEAWKQSVQGMPKATQGTAVALAKLKTAYEAWSNSMAPTVMPIFTKALNIARGALSGLTPLVKAAAGALGPFLDKIQAAVDGGAFDKWAAQMAKAGGPTLTNLLNGIFNLGKGFADLLVKLAPAGKQLSGVIDDMAASFANWAKGGGADSFADLAKKSVPAIQQLVTAAVKITGAFSPLAGTVVTVALALAKLVNAMPTRALQVMAPAIMALVVAWRLLSTVMIAVRLAMLAAAAATAINTAAANGNATAIRVQAIATRLASVAQAAWNVAIRVSTTLAIANRVAVAAQAVANTASAAASRVAAAASAAWNLAVRLLTTNLILQKVQLVASQVATVALTVAQTAARAATTAWAVATRLLNAAWRANPIGVVITVITLLVAAIVLAYKKSSTFRSIVQSLWGVLKKVGAYIAGFFIAAWNRMRASIDFVINVVKLVINWFRKIAVPAALAAIKRQFGLVRDAAQWVIDKVKSVIKWLKDIAVPAALGKIKSAFNAARTAANWLVDAVKSVINWIKKIPGGGLLSKAINMVKSAPAPAPQSMSRSLAATRAASTPVPMGAPQMAMATQVFVSIDGQQLQGRIDRTVTGAMRADGARLRAGGWA